MVTHMEELAYQHQEDERITEENLFVTRHNASTGGLDVALLAILTESRII
jgi:hypothetical protein